MTRVEAIVQWIKFGETLEAVAADYDLNVKQVQEAQAFYEVHKTLLSAKSDGQFIG